MKILLHICCANCAAYPAMTLRNEGHVLSGFWFNPNIQPFGEYSLRLNSLKKFADTLHVDLLCQEDYRPETFFKIFDSAWKGSENEVLHDTFPGFPERCRSCYRLRLEKTAREAAKNGYDAFSTTLLISPYQNIEWISQTGNECADRYNVMFYQRDFRPYFRESLARAKDLGMYRQNYCGCVFSREERKRKQKAAGVPQRIISRKK
jgi:predicted adenine nucleotide alpha hydrolase (AANH) superfamily ATPase